MKLTFKARDKAEELGILESRWIAVENQTMWRFSSNFINLMAYNKITPSTRVDKMLDPVLEYLAIYRGWTKPDFDRFDNDKEAKQEMFMMTLFLYKMMTEIYRRGIHYDLDGGPSDQL